MLRLIVAAGATALIGVSGSAAAARPTVAEINAAIASHTDRFVLANAYSHNGGAPGHGWIDLETGAGRWVSPNGQVMVQTVTPEAHDPADVVVLQTVIDHHAHTWFRTSREELAKTARPVIVDPLADLPDGARFTLLGMELVDGRQTYHFRSAYVYPSKTRMDLWFSTDHQYLIRITRTAKNGATVERVDNHWLPRTPANLALTKASVPTRYRQVSASP
jgi:hypothetical protein